MRIALTVLLAAAVALGADAPATRPARPLSPDELSRLVAELGRGSFRKRKETVRQIATCGTAALPALRRALDSPKQEIALAARELIAMLENVCFTGAKLRLEVDPPRVRWNEALRLRVVVENPNEFDVHVPWDVSPASTTGPAATAWQVGAMLDVGEYLTVVGPDGEEVEFRVDPIEDHERIEREVNNRLVLGPVGRIGPRASCVLELPSLNRGWARYPLLKKGRYALRFCYEPGWEDASWAEAGLGKVAAPEVSFEVVESAPAVIRESALPLRMLFRRDGGFLVAALENTWDIPQWVNLNVGSGAGSSQLVWMLAAADQEHPIVVPDAAGEPTAPAQVSIKGFRLCQPGEQVLVSRMEAAKVLAFAERNASGSDRGKLEVVVRYTNHVSAAVLVRKAAESRKEQDRTLAEWADTLDRPIAVGEPMSEPARLLPSP
jgi:hypothetical protein